MENAKVERKYIMAMWNTYQRVENVISRKLGTFKFKRNFFLEFKYKIIKLKILSLPARRKTAELFLLWL